MHDIQILLIFLFNTLNNFTVQLTTMHSLQACYNQSCFYLNLRTVVHYGQEVKSKKFQAYDHGNENQNYYGQDTPPEYRIDVITAPIATYWGDNDWLADPAVSIFFYFFKYCYALSRRSYHLFFSDNACYIKRQ